MRRSTSLPTPPNLLLLLLLFFLLLSLLIVFVYYPARDDRVPDYSAIHVGRMRSEDLALGSGREALPGDQVRVEIQAWIYDPAAPANRGAELLRNPMTIVLGRHEIPIGIEKGIYGMKEGGRRSLLLPKVLSEGTFLDGKIPVPKGAILLVEVGLIEAAKGETR